MVKLIVVGLGKMGISHLSIVRALPDVEVVGVVDSNSFVLGVLKKYTGIPTFSSLDKALRETAPDAVILATPSRLHAPMIREVLHHGTAVFCEKPMTLSAADSDGLTALAAERELVTQVGYHNRFVGTFAEVRRLLDQGAIGTVTHGLAEAYGPVVLKPSGGTWRSKSTEGGGCLYDYAAHVLDLVNWYLGEPTGVGGTTLTSVFSHAIDDEVASTLTFPGGGSVSVSVNWSDESVRKMTTRITLWGTAGRIFADRQEIQVYLRDSGPIPDGYQPGWNVKYTTELTTPVSFYLRGEEYTAQLEHFLDRVRNNRVEGINTFDSAARTDRLIDRMLQDNRRPAPAIAATHLVPRHRAPRRSLRMRLRSLVSVR